MRALWPTCARAASRVAGPLPKVRSLALQLVCTGLRCSLADATLNAGATESFIWYHEGAPTTTLFANVRGLLSDQPNRSLTAMGFSTHSPDLSDNFDSTDGTLPVEICIFGALKTLCETAGMHAQKPSTEYIHSQVPHQLALDAR